jgi:hypothetical protein
MLLGVVSLRPYSWMERLISVLVEQKKTSYTMNANLILADSRLRRI